MPPLCQNTTLLCLCRCCYRCVSSVTLAASSSASDITMETGRTGLLGQLEPQVVHQTERFPTWTKTSGLLMIPVMLRTSSASHRPDLHLPHFLLWQEDASSAPQPAFQTFINSSRWLVCEHTFACICSHSPDAAVRFPDVADFRTAWNSGLSYFMQIRAVECLETLPSS